MNPSSPRIDSTARSHNHLKISLIKALVCLLVIALSFSSVSNSFLVFFSRSLLVSFVRDRHLMSLLVIREASLPIRETLRITIGPEEAKLFNSSQEGPRRKFLNPSLFRINLTVSSNSSEALYLLAICNCRVFWVGIAGTSSGYDHQAVNSDSARL